MFQYKVIMVAVDIFSPCERLFTRLDHLASDDSEIHLVNVVQPQQTITSYGAYNAQDDSESIKAQAEKRMTALAESLRFTNVTIHCAVGKVADELEYVAQQRNVELIIIGAQEGKGVFTVLGSVASAIVHRADADVLTVKMR
ncbi:universal stress protein [Salinimonas sp. HHU 13199]|uniref:Universal stress protein n=1 Tax=Salinimonas profundi TaxID=2729140 RepID=A0ABR8LDT2_9ALTE|nr:universal stress protein [Salinimonas profundi]MBD3584459.1 universal stress protein [Salinimonas profundi]